MKKILVGIVTVFFVTSMVMLLSMFVGCKSDVSIENKTGAIKGLVKYKNGNVTDYSGIQVTLSSTNGLMAISDCNSRGIATNGRAITNYCTTDVNGNYTFEDVPEGVYTIYASSNSSVEKAVLTNVVVTANETVTASDLNLTATGSIKGKVTVNGKTENVLGLDVFIAGTSYVAKVGSDGSYEITDIPAKVGYMLCVQKGEQTFAIDTNIEVKANESVEVDTYNITYTSTGGTSDSFTWIGSFETAPENPTLFSAYFNTTDGCSYIWDGSEWQLLAKAGADGADGTGTNEMAEQITCTATENGILFTGMLLSNNYCPVYEDYYYGDGYYYTELTSYSPATSKYEIWIWDTTDTENVVEMVAIKEWTENDYNPWEYIYPLVESGKDYNFNVTIRWHDTIICTKDFKVTAIGGLGEYKVENADECKTFLSDDKVLSRTEQVFTDNPKVPILDWGTFYGITSVANDATSVWKDHSLWLMDTVNFIDKSYIHTYDLKETQKLVGWRDFEFINNALKGRKLAVGAQTRIKIAGYTYNDTVYFKLNDYMETFFDWDDEKERKVFLVYGYESAEGFESFKDVPNTEKRYLYETEEYASLLKESLPGAEEIWGCFIELDETLSEPVYIPDFSKIPEYADVAEYVKFTGNWKLYNEGNSLPCLANNLATSRYLVNGTDGENILAFAIPEIQLLKATANFYDEDGTLIDSETRENNNSNYYWNEIYLPSIPEKEGYIGLYWEDDYGNTYSDSRYANLTKPVTNFTPVYREAEKRTAYFYDEDGNQIAEPVVATESIYSSWWNEIYLPSIPEKEGYITPEYWSDDYGNRYSNGQYVYLYDYIMNFYAVYTEIPTEPEEMKLSTDDIIDVGDRYSFSTYVSEGTTYTVTWADSCEGAEELLYLLYTYYDKTNMSDVKVSAYDEYGNYYFTEVDSGYNNPQTFTAKSTGVCNIDVDRYGGYCAIKVTEN